MARPPHGDDGPSAPDPDREAYGPGVEAEVQDRAPVAVPRGRTEQERLRHVAASPLAEGVTPPPGLEDLVGSVAQLLEVEVALLSVVDADRQRLAARVGTDLEVVPLTHSHCLTVVRSARPLVLEDTAADPAWARHPTTTELGIRAYAGWPVLDAAGVPVASLCALSRAPRAWSERELAVLEALAGAATAALRAAQALEDARALRESAQTEALRLAFLDRVASSAAAAGSSRQVVTRLAGLVADEVADACVVHLRHGDRLEPVVTRPRRRGDGPASEVVGHLEAPAGTGGRPQVLPGDDALVVDLLGPQQATADGGAGGCGARVVLTHQGDVVGRVVAAWGRSVPPAEGLAALREMCSRAAPLLAVALRAEREHEMLVALQRGVLDAHLPTHPGLSLSAAYRGPDVLDAVGGDWYDAFHLSDGRLAVVVGDVAGHGAEAAGLTGQLRNALRAYAVQGGGPVAVVDRLDGFVADLLPDTYATLLYGEVAVDASSVRWVSAGHLPPVLLHADDGDATLADLEGLPVGAAGLGAPRVEAVQPLRPGDRVLMFTDGLVERRGEALDVGLDRLRDAVRRSRTSSAHVLRDRLLGELLDATPGDDATLMVLARAA